MMIGHETQASGPEHPFRDQFESQMRQMRSRVTTLDERLRLFATERPLAAVLAAAAAGYMVARLAARR